MYSPMRRMISIMGFFDDDENDFWDFMEDTGALDEKKKEKQRKKNNSDKNEKSKGLFGWL